MRYVLSLLVITVMVAVQITPAAAMSGYRETFQKEFLSEPWAGDREESDACIECHTSDIIKSEFRAIPTEWKKSWHYQNDVSCHSCHGGDPKDAATSMDPHRFFAGTPKPARVPEFCGKCHIGILKNYQESGHGRALKSSGKGPSCVTCHGSHNIQKASIDIINEKFCTKCHSYERSRVMRQALFLTEKKIEELNARLKQVKVEGLVAEEEEKSLFSTYGEFRTLFHTEDVSLVKKRTDEFTTKLGIIEKRIQDLFDELRFRRNVSAFLALIFMGMGAVILLIAKTKKL